eukprot:TRINITY_DN8375_c0_g1_i1.p1 TRINITY_DN8375_c0_g1~~TRINITY_DN8375_c0_g1_i1.p1  ORF type:complete len:319 (-),score=86.41 TRINITY_DN8375_c0_g1_i1:26-982(-)
MYIVTDSGRTVNMCLYMESASTERGRDLLGKVVFEVRDVIKCKGIYFEIEGADCCCWMGGSDDYRGVKTFFKFRKELSEILEVVDNKKVRKELQFEPGTYVFPIAYRIANGAPVSFRLGAIQEFRRGISYKITAIADLKDRPIEISMPFAITGKPEWSKIEPPKPQMFSDRKKFLLGGSLELKFKLERTYVAAGSDLKVQIDINNQSGNSDIDLCTLEFVEEHLQQTFQIAVETKKKTIWNIHSVEIEDFRNMRPFANVSRVVSVHIDAKKAWPSVKTPNQLLIIKHYLVFTLTTSGFHRSYSTKLPFFVLPPVDDGV